MNTKLDSQNSHRRKSSYGAADDQSPPSKVSRSSLDVDDATLLAENMRRTQARYVYSLVVFSNGRLAQNNIHKLHPSITGVRILGDNFVLIFDTEANCLQAYKDLTAQRDLRVEYYKSNINQRQSDSKINRMILMAQGMPESVTEERMQVLFPNALKTFLSRPNGKTPYAVVNFFDEQDAYETFKRCEGFTIDGFSVDVHYAFMPKDDQLNKREVYVYGIPGKVSMQRMKEIFSAAGELLFKHNRKAADNAPFYVHAKFDNDADAATIFDRVAELNVELSEARVVAQYVKIKTQHDYIFREDHNFLYHYSDSIAESLALPNRWIKEAQQIRAKLTGGMTPSQRKSQQKLRQKARHLEVKMSAQHQEREKDKDVGGSDGQSDNASHDSAENVPPMAAPYKVENLRDRTCELMNRWRGGSSREFIDFLLSGICDIIRDSKAMNGHNNNSDGMFIKEANDGGDSAGNKYWSRMRTSLETATAGDTLMADRRVQRLMADQKAERLIANQEAELLRADRRAELSMPKRPLLELEPGKEPMLPSSGWRRTLMVSSLPQPLATISGVSFFNNAQPPPLIQPPKRKSLLQIPVDDVAVSGMDDQLRNFLDNPSIDRPLSPDQIGSSRVPPPLMTDMKKTHHPPSFFNRSGSSGTSKRNYFQQANEFEENVTNVPPPRRPLLEPLMSARTADNNVIEEFVSDQCPRSLLDPMLLNTSNVEESSAVGPKKRALLESLEMLSQANDRFSPIPRFETGAPPYAGGRGRASYENAAATAAANNYYNNMAAYHNYYMQAMSAGQVAAPYLYDDYARTTQSVAQQPPPPPPPVGDSAGSSSGFFNNATTSSGGSYNLAARTAAASAAAAATNRNYYWT